MRRRPRRRPGELRRLSSFSAAGPGRADGRFVAILSVRSRAHPSPPATLIPAHPALLSNGRNKHSSCSIGRVETAPDPVVPLPGPAVPRRARCRPGARAASKADGLHCTPGRPDPRHRRAEPMPRVAPTRGQCSVVLPFRVDPTRRPGPAGLTLRVDSTRSRITPSRLHYGHPS